MRHELGALGGLEHKQVMYAQRQRHVIDNPSAWCKTICLWQGVSNIKTRGLLRGNEEGAKKFATTERAGGKPTQTRFIANNQEGQMKNVARHIVNGYVGGLKIVELTDRPSMHVGAHYPSQKPQHRHCNHNSARLPAP